MSAVNEPETGASADASKGVKRRLSESGPSARNYDYDHDEGVAPDPDEDVDTDGDGLVEQEERDVGTLEPPPPGAQELPLIKYEYLDHTADIQIHAWGDTIQEAYEQAAMAMFAYMTNIETVDNLTSEQIHAEGHDLVSLLFSFLDEFLFIFSADPNFIARKVIITSFDRENFKIDATGYGETFDLSKHPQGTEVKAITYSNMQVHESEGFSEVFVIIDI